MSTTINIHRLSRGVARGQDDVSGTNILHNATTVSSSHAPPVLLLSRKLGLMRPYFEIHHCRCVLFLLLFVLSISPMVDVDLSQKH